VHTVTVGILQLMQVRVRKTGEGNQVDGVRPDPGLFEKLCCGSSRETLPGFAGARGKLPDPVVGAPLEERGTVGPQDKDLGSGQQQLTGTYFLAQLPHVRPNMSHSCS
jgi:hypothetical protein